MNKLAFSAKHELFRRKALKLFAEFQESGALSPRNLRELQLTKFNAIYQHAIKHTEFYKKKYAGLGLDRISSFEDISKLPILTKSEIRTWESEFVATNAPQSSLRKVTTGGSTGVPLKIYHDKRFPLDVLGWRTFGWWGVHPSDDIAFIYRIQKTGWRRRLSELVWYPTKRIFLDASYMTPESMQRFAGLIAKHKPAILQGYVGAVFEFAKYCKRMSLKIPPPKAVWVTSAPLIESQRILMEEIFQAPVYDQYGSSEIFWVAAECKRKNGLHVFADSRLLEIVDPESNNVSPGTYGDIVLSDLDNYAFPILRYKNDDRGVLLNQRCACGIQLPLMGKVQGRVSDVVHLPNGASVAGEYLTTIFDDAPGYVHAFQIHQKPNLDIDLICELSTKPDARRICEEKRQDLEELTGGQMPVTLKLVDSLNHERGKTRFIQSDVANLDGSGLPRL